MTDWVQNLPVGGLIAFVLVGMLLVSVAIYLGVMAVAASPRGSRLGISPGMLPPLALVFGLLAGFLATQVWSNANDARGAVNDEASSLRSVVLLATAFPGQPENALDGFVREHIETAATREWPAMARQSESLTVVPAALAGALHTAIGLKPKTMGQQVAQQQIVTSLEAALDARRHRILLSQSSVNWIRWTAVIALALITLIAIAIVHSDNRRGAAVAMTTFALAAAVTIMVIATEDRPFCGPFRVAPAALLQVLPPSGGRADSPEYALQAIEADSATAPRRAGQGWK
jgi:hypothetical protein